MAFLSPFSRASRKRTRIRASTLVISRPEPSTISSPICRNSAASSRRRERGWGVRSVIFVVTLHSGQQECAPVNVKVLGVKLDLVRGRFHAEAGPDIFPVGFVERNQGAHGIFDVPAPLVKRANPELVRNVFLPFRGNLERAVDNDTIHMGSKARKDTRRGEEVRRRAIRGQVAWGRFLHWPKSILAHLSQIFPNLGYFAKYS